MPQLMAVSCPVCGAPFKPGDEKCSYCGSYIVIKTDLPKLDRRTLNQSVIQEHIADFRRRVRSDPYDEEAHYGLGIAYFSLGLTADAVDELTQAAKLMPENPHIQAQLAIALRDSALAGSPAAKQQMHARINSALLLDPVHSEATVLKAEVLLEEQQYDDAIALYQSLEPADQQRVKSKVVTALETLCEERLAYAKWGEAQRCWEILEPVDAGAAQRLAVRFLNIHSSLVPNTFKRQSSSHKRVASPSPSPHLTQSRLSRVLRTLLWAGIGLFAGLVQLIVVVVNIPTDETDTIGGWSVLAMMLSIVIFLTSPIVGAIVYRKRIEPSSGGKANRGSTEQPLANRDVTEKVRKVEILTGAVEMAVIQRVVDHVMEKLSHLGPMPSNYRAASRASKLRLQ